MYGATKLVRLVENTRKENFELGGDHNCSQRFSVKRLAFVRKFSFLVRWILCDAMSYLIWQSWPIGLWASYTYARGVSHADKKAAQCADLGRVRCRGYFGGAPNFGATALSDLCAFPATQALLATTGQRPAPHGFALFRLHSQLLVHFFFQQQRFNGDRRRKVHKHGTGRVLAVFFSWAL